MATASISQSPASDPVPWTDLGPGERLKTLEQLANSDDWMQYAAILAGREDIGLEEKQLIELLRKLPPATIHALALQTKSRAIATELVSLVSDIGELFALCLKAASVHVRKQAAMAIDDDTVLEELRETVRNKDKTIFKVVEQRLGQRQATAGQEPDSEVNEAGADSRQQSEDDARVKADKRKQARASDSEAELTAVEAELGKLSFKNTTRLNGLRNNLNRVRKQLGAAGEEIAERIQATHDVLADKLKQNETHQEQLKQATEDLLAVLKQALDEGQSHDALPAWDKIQGNISNTSGKLRAGLQAQANRYRNKLNELRDWKIFAATEKKKVLLRQMQHLIDSRMHATDKSKYIDAMHREWKLLGRSDRNEELWRKFRKLSDKAYEPCKEYFRQRKQLMAENLKQRREICGALEKELAAVDKDNINISMLNKLMGSSEQQWKRYAPVEQSKNKTLQKRYYGIVSQLRKLRKNALRENGNRKQQFIAQALKLAEIEDNRQAMTEAKGLQQEWKKIGPTSFREDKRYWEQFRTACDKIFSQRDQEAAKVRTDIQQAEASLNDILQSLEALSELGDDEFRKSRADYADFMQAFSNGLDPRIKKQRRKLLDRFNGLKRKIDARFKGLPNKKRQALMNAVLEKANFLTALEQELLNTTDSATFARIKQRLNSGEWETLECSAIAGYGELLQQRFQQLLQADSTAVVHELALASEKQIRSLCIELEIRAGLETPKKDQALRMQIQLDQLKQGFGHAKPDRQANTCYALDAEIKGICIGPLESGMQRELSQRLKAAINRLL